MIFLVINLKFMGDALNAYIKKRPKVLEIVIVADFCAIYCGSKHLGSR